MISNNLNYTQVNNPRKPSTQKNLRTKEFFGQNEENPFIFKTLAMYPITCIRWFPKVENQNFDEDPQMKMMKAEI